MKKLAEYIHNKYVSLKGLDNEITEKLSNLEGYEITECCGDYCGYGCCDGDCGIKPSCQDNTLAVVNPVGSVTTPEVEYPPIFKSAPKVQDVFNVHAACSYKCRFNSEREHANNEPVVLTDNEPNTCGKYLESDILRNDVLSICKEFELHDPVLLLRADNSIQLFGIKFSGTNGAECSIKNSLIDVADILTKLEKKKEVNWAQVLDVSIDNVDDIYDFLITCILDNEKYDKDLEKQAAKDMFPHPINNLGKKL